MSIRERQVLGQMAHEAASEQFLIARSRHHLLIDRSLYAPTLAVPRNVGAEPEVDVALAKYGNRFGNGADALDPYLDMVCWVLQTRKSASWPLEPAAPGHARRPDLADLELHEVYEIKPDNAEGRREGRAALAEFQNLLRQADAEYRAYADRSERYKGGLYETLVCQVWRGGAWSPHSVCARGPRGEQLVFHFRISAETPGLLLWSHGASRGGRP